MSNDKEVVLVVLSDTDLPGAEATKGFAKKDREANGLKGVVIRFVVINDYTRPPDSQPRPSGDYSRMPEWMKLDPEVGTDNLL